MIFRCVAPIGGDNELMMKVFLQRFTGFRCDLSSDV